MGSYESRKVYSNASQKAIDDQRYRTPSMAVFARFGDKVVENYFG